MKSFLFLLPMAFLSAASMAKEAVEVRLKTSRGDITLELDAAKAPITVENFLKYVREKHYDQTVFHRVIGDFMIQGGGFVVENGQLTEKKTSGKGIKNESNNGLKNLRGSIAMARTSDPDSARAQFFINVVDNPNLDFPSMGGYAVFGKVTQGMNVVDQIKSVATQVAPMAMRHPATGEVIESRAGDVPVEPVTILSAEIVE